MSAPAAPVAPLAAVASTARAAAVPASAAQERCHGTMSVVSDDSAARSEPAHVPVLLGRVRDLLVPTGAAAADPVGPGLLVDATVGLGGHAAALLEAAPPDVHLLGLDRDPAALAVARDRLARFAPRVHLRHARFDRIADEVGALAGRAPVGPVLGVLYDLGVSSLQLDEAARGFSFRADAPLDMRMDPGDPRSAADLLHDLDEPALTALLREHGDEPHARRIARAVVARGPVRTTGQLAAIVADAVPAARRRQRRHPATLTFQALRIAVNGELASFRASLPQALELVAVDAAAPPPGQSGGAPRRGGRILVLSYHSGEDRITKRTFAAAARGCVCPPGLPACGCGRRPTVEVLAKGEAPGPDEVAANPRARSARLRAVQALPIPPPLTGPSG